MKFTTSPYKWERTSPSCPSATTFSFPKATYITPYQVSPVCCLCWLHPPGLIRHLLKGFTRIIFSYLLAVYYCVTWDCWLYLDIKRYATFTLWHSSCTIKLSGGFVPRSVPNMPLNWWKNKESASDNNNSGDYAGPFEISKPTSVTVKRTSHLSQSNQLTKLDKFHCTEGCSCDSQPKNWSTGRAPRLVEEADRAWAKVS